MKDLNTEEKILFAAEQIFLKEGYDGSRMQQIADHANINKALLHYYFRSKQLLFEKVFDKKISKLFPKIEAIVTQTTSFQEAVNLFIDEYFLLLKLYPYLPLFIISTVSKASNQDFIKKLPVFQLQGLQKAYNEDLKKGLIKPINLQQFWISVIAMSAFPFMASPIIKNALDLDNTAFNKMMKNRKIEIKNYVKSIISNEK